jgi:hypothetical protein
MSPQTSWDDAQIHAYVDGELDAESAARLEADSRDNAALAARIAGQRDLRRLLRAEFDSVLDEAVPQRLRDALSRTQPAAAAVTPIGAARAERLRAQRPAWSLREWVAIAATLALGAVLGPFVFRSSTGLPLDTVRGQLVATDYLEAALSTQLAGSAQGGAAARIGLSFRTASGEYCRTFTLQAGSGGLACRRDGRWAVELLDGAAAEPAAPNGDFRPAASSLSPAMLGAITALGAGDPLTTEQEQQQLGTGWDAPSR